MFEDGKTGAEAMKRVSRRDFLKYAGVAGSTLFLGMDGGGAMSSNNESCFIGEDR